MNILFRLICAVNVHVLFRHCVAVRGCSTKPQWCPVSQRECISSQDLVPVSCGRILMQNRIRCEAPPPPFTHTHTHTYIPAHTYTHTYTHTTHTHIHTHHAHTHTHTPRTYTHTSYFALTWPINAMHSRRMHMRYGIFLSWKKKEETNLPNKRLLSRSYKIRFDVN
jgi:hypothetical protein